MIVIESTNLENETSSEMAAGVTEIRFSEHDRIAIDGGNRLKAMRSFVDKCQPSRDGRSAEDNALGQT